MDVTTLFILALGLAMDAFAVSICKGVSLRPLRPVHMLKSGLWFGGFQALMPIIGYMLGVQFESAITAIDHWIAFVLLAIIGGNMIRAARSGSEHVDDSMDVKTMFLLAVATSIDALAIGITFAVLNVNLLSAAVMIGAVTFVLSAIGIKAGSRFGMKYKSSAEMLGGCILIFIGVKVLVEHLEII
ncbi:MAG: manganese efflux pump [Tidjanibacter sp.]|nr:manganese efflux pump [Tidjanibacter sp.]